MPQVQGVIELVQGRQTGRGPIYDVQINGQVYSTFDPAASRIAQERMNQLVTADVAVKPSKDGQFQNYFFNGVVENGQTLPPRPGQPGAVAQPQPQPGVPMAQQLPMQPGIPMAAPAPASGPKMDPERESRIVKQSSMATAFNFVGSLYEGAGPEAMEEAEAAALALAKRLYVQVLGPPQTLDDEIVESLVQAQPELPTDEHESWQ